ncbi:MAG: hypothetical protein M1828_003387 [Chrysothrix sp. TS-e1954]|nr:MAG: hypothetical protein M1828_003387 [Chrysothrix sp. TS-e1954]
MPPIDSQCAECHYVDAFNSMRDATTRLQHRKALEDWESKKIDDALSDHWTFLRLAYPRQQEEIRAKLAAEKAEEAKQRSTDQAPLKPEDKPSHNTTHRNRTYDNKKYESKPEPENILQNQTRPRSIPEVLERRTENLVAESADIERT